MSRPSTGRPTPRAPKKPSRPTKSPARSKRGAGARPRGAQARRPRKPLRRRLPIRLPSLGRIAAGLLAASLIAGAVALVNGPWLRVAELAWAGERFTRADDLADALEPLRGASILTVDTGALAARLAALPAVEEVDVDARLPATLSVAIAEKAPAFVWRTRGSQLLGAEDGSIIAKLPRDAALPAELAELPYIDDGRALSRLLTVGDMVRADLVAGARRLAEIDPALLGSSTTRLTLRVEDEYGLLLVSAEPAWRAAFGYYGLDPSDTPELIAERIERQIGAVRTLFASHPETGLAWIDARNPGKVYFRAEG